MTEKWNLRPGNLNGRQNTKWRRWTAKPAAQKSRLKILDTKPNTVHLLAINRDLRPWAKIILPSNIEFHGPSNYFSESIIAVYSYLPIRIFIVSCAWVSLAFIHYIPRFLYTTHLQRTNQVSSISTTLHSNNTAETLNYKT